MDHISWPWMAVAIGAVMIAAALLLDQAPPALPERWTRAEEQLLSRFGLSDGCQLCPAGAAQPLAAPGAKR